MNTAIALRLQAELIAKCADTIRRMDMSGSEADEYLRMLAAKLTQNADENERVAA